MCVCVYVCVQQVQQASRVRSEAARTRHADSTMSSSLCRIISLRSSVPKSKSGITSRLKMLGACQRKVKRLNRCARAKRKMLIQYASKTSNFAIHLRLSPRELRLTAKHDRLRQIRCLIDMYVQESGSVNLQRVQVFFRFHAIVFWANLWSVGVPARHRDMMKVANASKSSSSGYADLLPRLGVTGIEKAVPRR